MKPNGEKDICLKPSVLSWTGFNKLGLTLISANCYPQNKRSQRVLEKMGFTYEGILHQAEVSYDDKIYDHLCYYLEKNNLK